MASGAKPVVKMMTVSSFKTMIFLIASSVRHKGIRSLSRKEAFVMLLSFAMFSTFDDSYMNSGSRRMWDSIALCFSCEGPAV